MANKFNTIFQNLDKALSGEWSGGVAKHVNSYNMSGSNDIIFKTQNKEEYETKKLELNQDRYLKDRWVKANVDLSVQAFAGVNNVRLMYRDADLMDAFPEIGAALDIVSEESCITNDKGQVINVSSKSERIKAILEDLFINRLDIQIMAQMVIRGMCKYGNQFMLLNVDRKNGVMGWKQLPVYEVERLENGITNPYGGRGYALAQTKDNTEKDLTTKFVWSNDTSTQVPFRNWQVAHFRLIGNSMYLPYGSSYLNAARRHWRMLSLMEDMMLIYRLERSIERRIYKIYVGAIDDADVQGYVQEIANNFKRTPIIDPMTGQLDLRKNILPVHKDTPIPLLDGRTITIAELAKEYAEGKENYVYSVQDNTHQIVPGKVVWCGKNYTAQDLVKITLDDDTYCIMAREHEVIMRNGSKKRADELVIGESVMPFYRKVDKQSKKLFDRYEQTYNPNSGKYEYTHRLIAKEVNKEQDTFNTVHHKDFNKYNNNPTNLLWCDYHEHHKMHSELAKRTWQDEEKRKIRIEKLRQSCLGRIISDEVKAKISTKLKEKYASGDLDWVKEKVSKNLVKYNQTEESIVKRRERGLKLGYRKEFEEYNNSELHKQHDAIRREKGIERWKNEEMKETLKKNMKVSFDEHVWNQIDNAVLNNEVKNQNEIIKFVNDNLIDYLISINSSKKLQHYRKITKPLIKGRLNDRGFANSEEYFAQIRKNHKIKAIEIIEGDDVYCMTVVGLNGEEDRHNFALCTWNTDGSTNQNGIFVSNCADNDIFIPTRTENAASPIETLTAAQNLTAIDDIKYIQNKVLTALRIPKSFLNFEDAAGQGQNLALMDVRFTRVINRIQQAFLMELTKVASIHLYLLGFEDDLTNFSISMNNPSTQAEQLEIDNITKKIGAVQTAVADPGTGMPIMSLQRALKEIMKWSEKDIQENFEEIRLEKALSNELAMTNQIIKRTGIFDSVDRTYGEPGAQYQEGQQGGDDGGLGGGAPGGGMPPSGGGGDFGEGLDSLGAPGSDEEGDISGAEGEMPIETAAGDNTPPPPMESIFSDKPLIVENKIKENKIKDNAIVERVKIYDDVITINEEIDNMMKSLNGFIENDKNKK